MKDFIVKTVKEAGKLALSYYGEEHQVGSKGKPTNIVTEADKAVNGFILSAINTAYPEHAIVSEEDDIVDGARGTWYVDPIDGTMNFTYQVPLWGIMIAYREDGDTKYAAVYCPITDDLFYAERGKGAFLNGIKKTVTSVDNVQAARILAVLSPGIPYAERFEKALHDLYFVHKRRSPKRLGTMLGACYMLVGAFDVFLNNGAQDYDCVAPALICEEAGGRVTDSDGTVWKPGRRDILFSNGVLHDTMLELLS